jgi:hypothetical protein
VGAAELIFFLFPYFQMQAIRERTLSKALQEKKKTKKTEKQ